jgi:pyruvate/2-oxoglutarate dehydrogenase complex dihydrolipoamide dehydrogenase (E3) component
MTTYNVVVIGAGSGGLTVAAGVAGLGGKVALLEKHKMGGDCLNYGCVPSKALIRAAKAVQQVREAHRFGVGNVGDPGPQDAKAVMDYVRSCQARIAPHDSVERFEGLGVEVFLGGGRLRSANEVEVGDTGKVLKAKHIVIATGSRARINEVPGLKEAGYLTNETVFDVETLPGSLLVMGGGPIGTEIGQSFARLGSKVTIVSSTPHICPKEDADIVDVLVRKLKNEGMTIVDGARATRVELRDGKKVVTVQGKSDGATQEIAVDEILVATGRRPNIEGLNLEGAGVAFDEKGIRTDDRCRTSVPGVWAIGDVAGGFLFTHWAGYQGRVIVRNTLFPGTSAVDYGNLPWTTFTEPEIAHVGLSENHAKQQGVPHTVFRAEFKSNDRAICDGEWEGYFAKVVADRKGKILGATIVHPHAGDLLAEIVLAKKWGLTLDKLSNTIHAYPTLSEIGRSLGDAYMRTKLTPGTKSKLTKFLAWARG